VDGLTVLLVESAVGNVHEKATNRHFHAGVKAHQHQFLSRLGAQLRIRHQQAGMTPARSFAP
jgi:hypothetical protein